MSQILFQIIIFISNTIQTITGFAGTMLAMPFSIQVVGIQEAKAVLNVFTLMACLVITVQNRKYIRYKVLAKMIAGMSLGMGIGVWLFAILPMEMLLKLYAVLVIGVALKKMLVKRVVQPPQKAMVLVLIASGIIHGMFLSGGALLVIYAVSVLREKDEFRATVAPVWVILNGILMVSHYRSGYYTSQNLNAILWSILPMAASIFLGNYLYKKINQQQFLKITYVLLIISGASLLVP